MGGTGNNEPVSATAKPIANSLIVTFGASVEADAQTKHVDDLKKQCAKFPNFAGVQRVLTAVLRGYVGEFEPSIEKWIRAQSEVRNVERDLSIPMASYVTTNTANWGLTKLSCAQDGKYFRLGNGGEGVIIHVLDDGYNPVESPYKYYPGATPEIETARLRFGESGDTRKSDSLHGHVAANLAAGTTLGAAPKATVMVHKVTVLTKPGVSEPRVSKALIAFDIIGQSIDKEKENGGKSTPRVINCSWGISDAIGKVLDADKNSFSAALDTLTHTYKCVVVVAAGNDSTNLKLGDLIPTGRIDCITVGNVDKNDKAWRSTNIGNYVDLYAPGVELPMSGYRKDTTKTIENEKRVWTGTSFASPLVAGLIACILGEHKAQNLAIPNSTEIKALLLQHCCKLSTLSVSQQDITEVNGKKVWYRVDAPTVFDLHILRNRIQPGKERALVRDNCDYCLTFKDPIFIDQ